MTKFIFLKKRSDHLLPTAKKTSFSKTFFGFLFLDIYKCPILDFENTLWKNLKSSK